MATWEAYNTKISNEENDEVAILAYLLSERIRRGISQREFAKITGMKQPQIARIERLDAVPTLTTLRRYATGLGLQVKLSVTA